MTEPVRQFHRKDWMSLVHWVIRKDRVQVSRRVSELAQGHQTGWQEWEGPRKHHPRWKRAKVKVPPWIQTARELAR